MSKHIWRDRPPCNLVNSVLWVGLVSFYAYFNYLKQASNWDGGIRVNGWVSGGALAAVHHGTRSQGLHAVWDW